MNSFCDKASEFSQAQKNEIIEICENTNLRQFTTDDIKKFRQELNTVIIAPYDETLVKGVGYNLTASNMIYSLSKRKLLTIHDNKEGKFFKLSPHDTVLILTNEYFFVEENVSGNFYSRVRLVSEGLGHISTTLDPNWRGMFLISLSNTSKKSMKVQISSKTEGKEIKIGIATVVLTGVKTHINTSDNQNTINLDNPAMRIDILKELVEEDKINVNYQNHREFADLVYALDNFKEEKRDIHDTIAKIRSDLQGIDTALMVEENGEKVKIHINSLGWLDFEGDTELKRKLCHLKRHLDKKNYDITRPENKAEIKQEIDVLRKECDYILLCENVRQIHEIIDAHINKLKKHDKINFVIKRIFEKLPSIFSIIVLFTIFILCVISLFSIDVSIEPLEELTNIKKIIITIVLGAVIPKLISDIFKK